MCYIIRSESNFCHFLVVLASPTLYKVETWEKIWIHASDIVCWVRGGLGLDCGH